MTPDLPQRVAIHEQYRRRVRDELAPVRAEFVTWLRDFFKKRKPTTQATRLSCQPRGYETRQPVWWFSWEPGRTRTWIFKPANPLPPFATAAHATALGLRDADVTMLQLHACYDLAVDAWAEAGGFAFARPLAIITTVFRGPDDPRPWIGYLWEQVHLLANKPPRPGSPNRVHPPASGKLPEAPAAVIDAVRSGAPGAVDDWAGAIAARGDPAPADLLRWVIRFRDTIAQEVRLVAPTGGFYLHSFDGITTWIVGDCDVEVVNENTRNLSRLLAGWNDFHPAVEWLYRTLDLTQVTVETARVSDGRTAAARAYNLAAGDHLEPVDPTVGVTRLSTNPVDAE